MLKHAVPVQAHALYTVETGWNSAPLIILVSLFYCFCEEIRLMSENF